MWDQYWDYYRPDYPYPEGMDGSKSSDSPNGGSDLTFQTVFPSDSLAGFAALLRSLPALAIFARELIQLRLVLDANEVQRQIRFRLSRTKAHARSGLHEAIAAGVVIAFVPRFIDDEIAKYLALPSRL